MSILRIKDAHNIYHICSLMLYEIQSCHFFPLPFPFAFGAYFLGASFLGASFLGASFLASLAHLPFFPFLEHSLASS